MLSLHTHNTYVYRLKSSLEEALASNREQASDIANLQDELRRIHSSFQVRLNISGS